MRFSLLPLLFLAACGSDAPYTQGGSLNAIDYVPATQSWLQFGPAEAPADGPFLMIEVSDASWELRQGPEWTDATSEEQLPVTSDDGLSVAGALLLPAEITEGAEQDGVTVLTLGDEQVYYGTFTMAVRTSVASGRFAGEWAFAPTVGPIALTVDGQVWELVYYE